MATNESSSPNKETVEIDMYLVEQMIGLIVIATKRGTFGIEETPEIFQLYDKLTKLANTQTTE